MKTLVIAIVALFLIQPLVQSATPREPAKNPKQVAEEKNKKREEDKAARGKKRAAIQAVLEVKDKNHDGALSLAEYIADEADAAAATKNFEKFNTNKDLSLSKGEIAASLGL